MRRTRPAAISLIVTGTLAVGVAASSVPFPASGAAPSPAAPPHSAVADGATGGADGADAAGAAQGARGVIEGVVLVGRVAQRRAAARYPGGGTRGGEIQEIGAVVFLKGPVGGHGASGGSLMGQRDERFEPSLLVVPVGSVVEFPNHDPIFHNVFSYSSAARFDLGRYPQGESKEVRFDEAGVVKVYCEVHETMRAAIVVVENAHWAHLDDDGRFRLEGVPAGTHTLVAWHADRRAREVEVTVPAGGSARVELEL